MNKLFIVLLSLLFTFTIVNAAVNDYYYYKNAVFYGEFVTLPTAKETNLTGNATLYFHPNELGDLPSFYNVSFIVTNFNTSAPTPRFQIEIHKRAVFNDTTDMMKRFNLAVYANGTMTNPNTTTPLLPSNIDDIGSQLSYNATDLNNTYILIKVGMVNTLRAQLVYQYDLPNPPNTTTTPSPSSSNSTSNSTTGSTTDSSTTGSTTAPSTTADTTTGATTTTTDTTTNGDPSFSISTFSNISFINLLIFTLGCITLFL